MINGIQEKRFSSNDNQIIKTLVEEIAIIVEITVIIGFICGGKAQWLA